MVPVCPLQDALDGQARQADPVPRPALLGQ
jgi:hypothetical protein